MKRLLICVLALALLAGCAPASVQEPEDGKLHIVATVFPAYDFARAAAGDLADVELLLPPGTESHSYEPTPADILKVQSCDLFLYLGGDSDQWVETILEAAEPTGRTLALIDCVETLEEEHVEGMQEEVGHHHDEDEDDHDHDHLGTVTEIDEHVWTAPANAAAITRQFGEVLAELDSANGERYRANAEKYAEEIDTLDGEFHAFFDSLPDRTMVFGDRFPLRYFAEEFDLRYYAAFPGCSTQTEPSAATIAFLTDKVREEGISTVWYIEFSNHLVADAIAAHKARLVLLAADASERTGKKTRQMAGEKLPVLVLPADKDALGAALGKGSCAVAAVLDGGFAAKLAQMLAQGNPDYAAVAERLNQKEAKRQRRKKEKPRTRKKSWDRG